MTIVRVRITPIRFHLIISFVLVYKREKIGLEQMQRNLFLTCSSLLIFLTSLLGCMEDSSSNSANDALPVNEIDIAYFRDLDGAPEKIAGEIVLSFDQGRIPNERSYSLFWVDEDDQIVGENFLQAELNTDLNLTIPDKTEINPLATDILIYAVNENGISTNSTRVKYLDYRSNVQATGPGGHYESNWEYGSQRPKLDIYRDDEGTCIFDNGLVAIIDMNNETDPWELDSNNLPNVADDLAFPAYQFPCTEVPKNTYKPIIDDYGIFSYSAINDAMYHGGLVYDAFLEFLGEPPLEEKLRIRVHYDHQSKAAAFWDGAYANFGDGIPFFFSMVNLDFIAHEIAHGVLNRIANLESSGSAHSHDVRTLHEAFADISAVMVKYHATGKDDIWIHGQGSGGPTRALNRIQTEYGAINSYFDYEDAGKNYYKRIGMLSYPFYLLSQKWGIEQAYQVYLSSARNCWFGDADLLEIAECILLRAGAEGYSEDDVISAFKTVKIKLFEEGVLSHFTAEGEGTMVEFTDSSVSTGQVIEWHWDFGDGNSENTQNPTHTYSDTGYYLVTLTVKDNSGDQDQFYRSVAVF